MSPFALRLVIYLPAAFILSFLICLLIYRLPREKNPFKFESSCPNCEEHVSPWRFIPLFGYIFSKGKYKCCDEKMSLSRLLVPILFVGLCLLSVWIVGADFAKFGSLFPKKFDNASAYLEMHRVILCVFAASMLIVIFSDFETRIIPDTCHIITMILGILAIIFKMTNWAEALLGGVIFFIAFFIIMRLAIRFTGNENAFGGGDVKLISSCAFFLGVFRGLLGLLIGSISALLIEGILILTKLKKKENGIAFGPYLAIGMLIAAFFGNYLVDAYNNLLGIA